MAGDFFYFGSVYVDLAILIMAILFGAGAGYWLFNAQQKRYDTRGSGRKTKVCPLCRIELEEKDEIFGRLKAGVDDKVIILGCRFCYKKGDF